MLYQKLIIRFLNKRIVKATWKFLKEKNILFGKMPVIECDVNTGKRDVVIRRMEEKLQKPLQPCMCQLYARQLPLRHLFKFVDDPTSGPKAFSGPIGKSLSTCERLSATNFIQIKSDMAMPLQFFAPQERVNINDN